MSARADAAAAMAIVALSLSPPGAHAARASRNAVAYSTRSEAVCRESVFRKRAILGAVTEAQMAWRDGCASMSCFRLGYTGVGFDDMRAAPSSGSRLIALGAALAVMIAGGYLELTESFIISNKAW